MKLETTGSMLYRANYKYRNEREWGALTPFPWSFRITDLDGRRTLAELRQDRWLMVYPGYCWDGPSGPTLDNPISIMISSLHDVPYQGARLGHVPQEEENRKLVDDFFRDALIALGFPEVRADAYHEGVRLGARYAWERKLEEVHEAPSGKVHMIQPGSEHALNLLGIRSLVPA